MTEKLEPLEKVERARITEIVKKLGVHLGFHVESEVPASRYAWVDVVWFDNRFKFHKPGSDKPMTRVPVLPIVGFEIEWATGAGTKQIKGSVSNLNNLGAQMGIIVLGKGNFENLKHRKSNAGKNSSDLWKILLDKMKLWVYAEARPTGRIVIITEDELIDWAKHEKVIE